MSESSQSLHFWRASVDEVRAWAKARAIQARFVASNAHWCCVLTYEQDEAEVLASAADGLAVLWSFDDDCALELRFYVDRQALGSISLAWRGFGAPGTASLPDPILSFLLERGVLSSSTRTELEEVARAVAAGEIHGRTVRDRVATRLDLAAYEWLSSAVCIEQSIEDFRKDFAEAEDLFD